MIPKRLRFTTRLFDKAFRRSQRIGMGMFSFLVSDDSRTSHMSVVVGKKISKSAVTRNRLRRQMYEILRTDLAPKIKNKNIICLYKGPEKLQNGAEFKSVIQRLLQKLFPRKNSHE
ncbi:ribonuclease P protein component [Candidatus Gracilibacteria bacterium]|nr:ribonuclease P protein component [Candidatus Gracilibacteria bacterium]